MNIKIELNPTFLASIVPSDVVPKRFAIATNILLVEKKRGLLLFNYEPQKWNQWYPFFSSVNDMYKFDVKTYGDLIDTFSNRIIQREDVRSRFQKATQEFGKLIGASITDICVADSPIPSEYWLKYSKTQNIWTLYYMEFLQIKSIHNADIDSLPKDAVDFLPLDIESINSATSSKAFKGTPIVDNTLELIQNPIYIASLKNHSVSL